jgi:pantoate--beta-alanine ligase
VELIGDADAFARVAEEWRAQGLRVGFHPTMGALHAGHAANIRLARAQNDRVAVSIFVNPLQFGPSEDFERYPRPLQDDLALGQREGVDVVWAPTTEQMYPPGVALVEPDPGPVGETFEGRRLEPRAQPKITHRVEAFAANGHDRLRVVFFEAGDFAKAQAHGAGSADFIFHRDVAGVDFIFPLKGHTPD